MRKMEEKEETKKPRRAVRKQEVVREKQLANTLKRLWNRSPKTADVLDKKSLFLDLFGDLRGFYEQYREALIEVCEPYVEDALAEEIEERFATDLYIVRIDARQLRCFNELKDEAMKNLDDWIWKELRYYGVDDVAEAVISHAAGFDDDLAREFLLYDVALKAIPRLVSWVVSGGSDKIKSEIKDLKERMFNEYYRGLRKVKEKEEIKKLRKVVRKVAGVRKQAVDPVEVFRSEFGDVYGFLDTYLDRVIDDMYGEVENEVIAYLENEFADELDRLADAGQPVGVSELRGFEDIVDRAIHVLRHSVERDVTHYFGEDDIAERVITEDGVVDEDAVREFLYEVAESWLQEAVATACGDYDYLIAEDLEAMLEEVGAGE